MSTNTSSIPSEKTLNEDSMISTSTTISVITEPNNSRYFQKQKRLYNIKKFRTKNNRNIILSSI